MTKLIPGTPISVRVGEGAFVHGVVVGEQFQSELVAPRPILLPNPGEDVSSPLLEKVNENPMYVSRWAQARGVTGDMVREHGLTFPPSVLTFVYYICFRRTDTEKPLYLPFNQVSNSYNKSNAVRGYADRIISERTGTPTPVRQPQESK